MAEARGPSIGSLVAAEARAWVGTPFEWQASRKGVGCDCKGLVAGVARELGLREADSLHARMASYPRRVDSGLLREGLAAVFDRADEPAEGDVLLLCVRGKPQHLAICAGISAIHAQIAPAARVKETRLAALLRLAPIDSIWRWRSGD